MFSFFRSVNKHKMAFSWMKKAPQGPQIDKAPPEGIEAFKNFYDADSLEEILKTFNQVCDFAKIERGGRYREFFPYLKAAYLVGYQFKNFLIIDYENINLKTSSL